MLKLSYFGQNHCYEQFGPIVILTYLDQFAILIHLDRFAIMTHLEQSIILPYLNQFPILTYEDQFPILMYLDHLPFWLISTGFLFWPFCTSLPFWLIWSDFYYLTHVDLFINRTPLDSVCNVTIFNLFSILIDLDQLAILSHSDRFIDSTYLD